MKARSGPRASPGTGPGLMPESRRPANFYGTPAAPGHGAWAWVFAPESAIESPGFAGRLDAQAWLGEHLDKLRTAAVLTAQLTHQGQAVGGEISLGQRADA